jgi:hypothetical protein
MANPNSFVAIDIQGITTIQERLKRLPDMAKDMGVETANEYIVNVMKIEPAKPSRPFVWSSDKQRKYVMAKIRRGEWTGRTQQLRNGWKTIGSGWQQMVVNEVPYAEFVQGDNQIIGHKTNNWKTTADNLKDRGREILAKFDAGVKKALKKLKLN